MSFKNVFRKVVLAGVFVASVGAMTANAQTRKQVKEMQKQETVRLGVEEGNLMRQLDSLVSAARNNPAPYAQNETYKQRVEVLVAKAQEDIAKIQSGAKQDTTDVTLRRDTRASTNTRNASGRVRSSTGSIPRKGDNAVEVIRDGTRILGNGIDIVSRSKQNKDQYQASLLNITTVKVAKIQQEINRLQQGIIQLDIRASKEYETQQRNLDKAEKRDSVTLAREEDRQSKLSARKNPFEGLKQPNGKVLTIQQANSLNNMYKRYLKDSERAGKLPMSPAEFLIEKTKAPAKPSTMRR